MTTENQAPEGDDADLRQLAEQAGIKLDRQDVRDALWLGYAAGIDHVTLAAQPQPKGTPASMVLLSMGPTAAISAGFAAGLRSADAWTATLDAAPAIPSPAVKAEPLTGQEMRRAFEADYRKRHGSRLYCESEWRGWQAGVAACISGAALSQPPVQGSE